MCWVLFSRRCGRFFLLSGRVAAIVFSYFCRAVTESDCFDSTKRAPVRVTCKTAFDRLASKSRLLGTGAPGINTLVRGLALVKDLDAEYAVPGFGLLLGLALTCSGYGSNLSSLMIVKSQFTDANAGQI
jgi:hypothetical protein